MSGQLVGGPLDGALLLCPHKEFAVVVHVYYSDAMYHLYQWHSTSWRHVQAARTRSPFDGAPLMEAHECRYSVGGPQLKIDVFALTI